VEIEQADQLRLRVSDGDDLHRPTGTLPGRKDRIDVSLGWINGSDTDDRWGSGPVDPATAEPGVSK